MKAEIQHETVQEARQYDLFEAKASAEEISAWQADLAQLIDELARMVQQLEDTPLFKAIKVKKEQIKELRQQIADATPAVIEALAGMDLPKR